MSIGNNYHPIILCILDGFGISEPKNSKYDAISQANPKFWKYLLENYPNTELKTSGIAVGLPEGQMGNSEVGHMTIGSGRIIFQDFVRISQAIEDGSLANNSEIKNLIATHIKSKKSVHLLGLCSDGGVHAHINHLIFLSELLAKAEIAVKLHLFLDGRDTPPKSAKKYLSMIDELTSKYPNIKIATIAGRFYAMDRDNRLQRTEASKNAICFGDGEKINNWQEFLNDQYALEISDEFIPPRVFRDYAGINENDSIIFTNFRSDRIIQIAKKILKFKPKLAFKIGMTGYSEELNEELICLFPKQTIQNSLGEILSNNNKTQLRIAETEKYAHVTFFFNGGAEDLYLGEERVLIPSPDVDTYDLKPEMSTNEVTDRLIDAIKSKKYDFIVVNYANGDMVGHSGNMKAAIEAVKTLDIAIERISKAVNDENGFLIITADHGNVEYMFDEANNTPHTSHTLNPVPLVLVANDLYKSKIKLDKGTLSDIAPLVLKLMNIDKPKEMTGNALIKDKL